MHLARRSFIVIVAIIIAWVIYLPLADITRSEDGCSKADCTYLPAAAVANDSQSEGLTLSKSKIFRYQNHIILYAEAVNMADVRIHDPTVTLIFRSAQNEIIDTLQTPTGGGLTMLDPGERIAFSSVYFRAPYEIEPKLEYMASWRTDEPTWHEAPVPVGILNPRIVEADYYGMPQPFLEATIKNSNPMTVSVYLQNLAVYDDAGDIELVARFTGVGCSGCDELGPNEQIEVSALVGEIYEPVDFASIAPADIVVYATERIQEKNCGTYCQ
jgi:hypothetical protein